MADDLSLERFVEAQDSAYATALGEILRRAKRSHWMWFVFPQLTGLGHSETARFFGIRSLEQATAYLDHPMLGRRYLECVGALQHLGVSDPVTVFGSADAMKLRSSPTLFEAARPTPLFAATLDRWFAGQRDNDTLRMLEG